MSIPFRQAPFKTSAGTTARSLDAWFSDVINVREFGATGNGSTDDRPAIQAAFDLAFGSSSSPHGLSGRFSNRPVFFPSGDYAIYAPLNLTKIVGGHIYGAGKGSTRINYGGAIATAPTKTPVLRINGAVDLCIERISLQMNDSVHTAASCTIDLDWDGVTTNGGGLRSNHFNHCAFGMVGGNCCVVLAGSGNEGYGQLFEHCTVGGGEYGIDVRGPNAVALVMCGGGEGSQGTYRCPAGGGALHSQGGSLGGGGASTIDFIMESGKTISISGARTENAKLLRQENGIVYISSFTNAGGSNIIEVNGGKCVMECASLDDTTPPGKRIIGTGGSLYVSATYNSDALLFDNYSGSVLWNPDGTHTWP